MVLVVAFGFASAGLVAATGTASAANAIQMQYGNKTEGWHIISSDGAYGYFGQDGWYTGRFMTESAFNKMAGRLAYGVQHLGTGVGSGYSANASNGVAVAEKLKTVGVGAGTLATLRQLKGEGLSLMARMKSFGVLRAVGDVALAATAFEVGYKVGGVVADLFGFNNGSGEEEPKVSTHYHATAEIPVEAGEVWCENTGCSGGTTGTKATPFAVSGLVTKWVPNTGGSARYDLLGAAHEFKNDASCEATWSGDNAPPGSSRGASKWLTNCGSKTGQNYHELTVVPLEVAHLPGEAGGSPKSTVTGTPQTPKSASSAEQDAKECLGGAASCGKLGGWWWNNDPEAKAETQVVAARLGLDPADPLSVHIPTPELGEKYTHYDERLEALGLVPEASVLAESQIGSEAGPEGVVATTPHIGSNVEPKAHVKVRYNPATAANTAEEEGLTESGGSGWSPPAIPAIDMSPLAGVASPCDVFPFGVFCWLGEALGQFNTTGVCPHFSAPVAGTESDFSVTLCGETSETIMGYLRPAILLVFVVGLGFLFARGTRAVGGD